jgi:pimeloyl-ACP methyl ester carboxylesterase
MLALAAIAMLALAGGALVAFTSWLARRAQAAVPPLGTFLDLEGSRIHHVDVGPAAVLSPERSPAVVMIHGLGGTMRSFTYALRDDLKEQFRVVALDRPGSGYSTRPDDRAGVTHQADQIASFIARKNLRRPLVVGHSFGGAIALALALDYPGSVGALALIAPLTHPQSTIPEPFRFVAIHSPMLRWLAAWTLAAPLGIIRRNEMLEAIFGPDPVPEDFGTRGGGLLGFRPVSFYSMSTDLVALGEELTNLSKRYGRLEVPVGILFGSADRILDPRLHGFPMADKVDGLHLEVIEGGGHMSPITAPGRTADFIRLMAARIPRASVLAG